MERLSAKIEVLAANGLNAASSLKNEVDYLKEDIDNIFKNINQYSFEILNLALKDFSIEGVHLFGDKNSRCMFLEVLGETWAIQISKAEKPKEVQWWKRLLFNNKSNG